MKTNKDITVLYITGWCRSGSTIIGNILNEIDGFCHLGELHFLWKNALGKGTNTKCGCGRNLDSCEIWSKVLEFGAGKPDWSDYAERILFYQRKIRTRHTGNILYFKEIHNSATDYLSVLENTYRSINEITGNHVLVDSGKFPSEAALLSQSRRFNVKYLHLVRDPRAVAYSWSKKKEYIYRLSPVKSTAYWIGFNVASHMVSRRRPGDSILMKYENFVKQPQHSINEILTLVDEKPDKNPLKENKVTLGINHSVTGNPDRFRRGETEIKNKNAAWTKKLSRKDSDIISLIARPLMHIYNY